MSSLIPFDLIRAYRAKTFRTAPGLRLKTVDEALDYMNQIGFIFFWPTKGIEYPNLWSAVAGDRPVADEHDDPGHVTWGWKDGLLGKKLVYYARVLKRRNTFVSLRLLPYFYALSPNYGEPEIDYLDQYEQGLLTAEAKAVFEALLNEGPLDTIALRRAAHLSGTGSDTRFNRALDDLQMQFRAMPIGVCDAGSWHYAFVYDLTHRQYPEVIPQAGIISENQARETLFKTYLHAMGAAPKSELLRMFNTNPAEAKLILERMLEANQDIQAIEVDQQAGQWIGTLDFCQQV